MYCELLNTFLSPKWARRRLLCQMSRVTRMLPNKSLSVISTRSVKYATTLKCWDFLRFNSVIWYSTEEYYLFLFNKRKVAFNQDISFTSSSSSPDRWSKKVLSWFTLGIRRKKEPRGVYWIQYDLGWIVRKMLVRVVTSRLRLSSLLVVTSVDLFL